MSTAELMTQLVAEFEAAEPEQRASLRRMLNAQLGVVCGDAIPVPSTDGFAAVMTPYSSIEAKLTKWAWEERLPLGALGLMTGTEGLGKTAFGLQLVAKLTRGELPGDLHGTPVKVALLTPEDDAGATIRKRLDAAGADVSRVFDLQMKKNATARGFCLPGDTAVIAQALLQGGADFVFADPLASMLDPSMNSWKDTDIRDALEPIIAVCSEHDITLLGSLHTNKSSSTDVRQRGMGSAGWRQLARAQLLVGLDPDDPTGADGSARCVALTKHNLGPWKKTQRFTLETVPVAVEGRQQDTVRATLGDECDVTSAAMLAAEQGHENAGDGKQDRATRWLRGLLEPGPVARKAVEEAADAAGHAWRTIERAKKEVGAEAFQPKGAQGWTWRLPESTLTF